MALHWDFKEKVGEAYFIADYGNGWEEYKVNIYNGNALMILVYEYEEDGVQKYSLNSFFADEQHLKNCLGLAKGYEGNIFVKPYERLTKLRLTKNCRKYDKIFSIFAKAFDELEMEIYNE